MGYPLPADIRALDIQLGNIENFGLALHRFVDEKVRVGERGKAEREVYESLLGALHRPPMQNPMPRYVAGRAAAGRASATYPDCPGLSLQRPDDPGGGLAAHQRTGHTQRVQRRLHAAPRLRFSLPPWQYC